MKRFVAAITLTFCAAIFVVSTTTSAADYVALRCLMETHPNWPTVTDEDMVTWLNTDSINYRPVNAPSRDIWDVIILQDDYDSMTEPMRDLVKTTLFAGGNSEVDISTNLTPVAAALIRAFTGTPTLSALNNAFTYQWSPCDSIGWGADCHLGDVQNAQNETCI